MTNYPTFDFSTSNSSCSKCNDTGVKDWGPVNATGRNDDIVYCSCEAGKKAKGE